MLLTTGEGVKESPAGKTSLSKISSSFRTSFRDSGMKISGISAARRRMSWQPEIGMEHASRGRRSGNNGVGARSRGRFRIFSARHCSRTKVSHAENSGMTMLFFSLEVAPVSEGDSFTPSGVVMRRRAASGEDGTRGLGSGLRAASGEDGTRGLGSGLRAASGEDGTRGLGSGLRAA